MTSPREGEGNWAQRYEQDGDLRSLCGRDMGNGNGQR